MRPARVHFASALLGLTALLAAACTQDAYAPTATATAEGGTQTATATETPATATATATTPLTPEGGDGPTDIRLTQTCESDRYTVDYPEGWHTNSNEVADAACGWFSPEPFEVEPATELITQVMLSVEPVPYDTLVASISPDAEVIETTIDGRRALRSESSVEEGLVPTGTQATQYFVDLGDSEALIATTYDLDGFDYEANRAVLDAMIETLSFTGE